MVKKIVFLIIVLCCLPIHANSETLVGWEKQIIGQQSNPIYLYVKDMDGDGDLDVASTTNDHPEVDYPSEVAWYRNNMNQELSWEKIIISSSTPSEEAIKNSNGIVIADIDGDGHEDVAVATGIVIGHQGSVYWFKAPSNPTGTWEKYAIETGVASSYFKIYTMDANEDSKDDLIVGGTQGAVLFINPGNPTQGGAVWEKVALPSGTGESIYLDDLNGDGKLDVINANRAQGNLSWVDVDFVDGEIIFELTMIDGNLDNAFDVNCMDVNGDLKKDVLVTIFQAQAIYWYEAPSSSGDPWTQHLVSDSYECTDLYTGDINDDGRVDFVVAGLFSNVIPWFEYNQSLWVENMIDNNVAWPGDISLDDLDGDGDLDVVLAGLGENQMIWYENKVTDWDADGILNEDDNCPSVANGPLQGTCSAGTIGIPCMMHGDCGCTGYCSKDQEDTYPPQGNDIGNACDCEGDFDCDGDVDGTDAANFAIDFERTNCTAQNPCNGDFDCDGDVDTEDETKFLEDFGRSQYDKPCPACIVGDWCAYQ